MTHSLRAWKCPEQVQRRRNLCAPVYSAHQVILLSTLFITLGHGFHGFGPGFYLVLFLFYIVLLHSSRHPAFCTRNATLLPLSPAQWSTEQLSSQRRNLKPGGQLRKSDMKSLSISDKRQKKLDKKGRNCRKSEFVLSICGKQAFTSHAQPVSLWDWWHKPAAGREKDPLLIFRPFVKDTKSNKHEAPDRTRLLIFKAANGLQDSISPCQQQSTSQQWQCLCSFYARRVLACQLLHQPRLLWSTVINLPF